MAQRPSLIGAQIAAEHLEPDGALKGEVEFLDRAEEGKLRLADRAGEAGLGPVGDLLGHEDLQIRAVAHPLGLGPEGQVLMQAPDGGQMEPPEHGLEVGRPAWRSGSPESPPVPPHLHGVTQAVLGRRSQQRLHAGLLQPEPLLRHDARGPASPLLVDQHVPLQELTRQIVLQIRKAPSPEEAPLHEADQIFDRSLLLRTPGGAELHGESVVQRHLAQGLIPDRPAPLHPHHNGLGPIEHNLQRYAARLLEAGQQHTHQRLDPLVGHRLHPDPARILQAVGSEMHPLPPPVQKPDVDLAEVELGKLTGHPFEAHHHLHRNLLSLCPVRR